MKKRKGDVAMAYTLEEITQILNTLQPDVAQAKADIGALRTDVTTAQNNITALQTNVAQDKIDIGLPQNHPNTTLGFLNSSIK
jgi:hypothetical protein